MRDWPESVASASCNVYMRSIHSGGMNAMTQPTSTGSTTAAASFCLLFAHRNTVIATSPTRAPRE